jgi:hypothetical protein
MISTVIIINILTVHNSQGGLPVIDASSSGVPYKGMRRFPEEETEHEGISYCYALGDLIYRMSSSSLSPSFITIPPFPLSLLPSLSFPSPLSPPIPSFSPLHLSHSCISPLLCSLLHLPSPLFPPVGYHVYGWRDLFDTAVRWRQSCEPMDVVYWLDR